VKIFPYNQTVSRMFCMVMLTAAMLLAFAHAGTKPPDTDKKQEEKIHISAETLISDKEAKYAEFIGNVIAKQGNTVITADRLKIFYEEVSGKEKSEADKSSPITKITAEGKVTIKFDDKIAETGQAVYTTADKVLTLSGEGSRLVSGNDSIAGSKIIFYRSDGRIKVESSKEKRVEAVFYPGGKGIE